MISSMGKLPFFCSQVSIWQIKGNLLLSVKGSCFHPHLIWILYMIFVMLPHQVLFA